MALLRGVNVGRNKRLAMADLRRLLGGLGYREVATVLQSGNAVFTCPAASVDSAPADIQAALASGTGVECAVMVRTAAEFLAALDADPLLGVATDPTRHLVGFLSGEPDRAGVDDLLARDLTPDALAVVGQQVYLWAPNGVLDSAFSKFGWDRCLRVSMTMRNRSTLSRIAPQL